MAENDRTDTEGLLRGRYADRSSTEKLNLDDIEFTLVQASAKRSTRWRVFPWCFHFGLVAAYTAVFFVSLNQGAGHTTTFGLLDCKLIIFDLDSVSSANYIQLQQNRLEMRLTWKCFPSKDRHMGYTRENPGRK
jgi:hypothetical protein